jgi:deoxyribonuclease V
MTIPIPHPWNLSPADAIAVQKQLAAHIDTQTAFDLKAVRLVAGVDVSVKDDISRAAVVVLTFPGLEIIEIAIAMQPASFPYIPGLLSFREGQVILHACEKLRSRPDVYIFDGQGIAHPRRIGIASHIGLWLNAPTVGCAKTWFIGDHASVGANRGDFEAMNYHNEIIGAALRTRAKVKIVYVSPGHLATVDCSRELVLQCATRYRLPEPTRQAHIAAGRIP